MANFQNIKWLDYTQNLMDTQKDVLQSNEMFDVLIGVGQHRFKAHQLVLSACSDFLKDVLAAAGASTSTQMLPTIIIPDMNPMLFEPLLEFMYTGESFVPSNILSEFLEACSFLRIRGFTTYDCLVNGIRLQQDPKRASVVQPPAQAEDDSENDHKALLVMPSNTVNDILTSRNHVDLGDTDLGYSYTIEGEEDTTNTTSMENTGHQEVAEIITGETITSEEYLDDDDEMMISKTEITIDPEDIKSFDVAAPSSATSGRPPKTYTEATLIEAIEELRGGAAVADVAAKFDIPRSTIYSKLRQSKDPVYRKYRSSHLEDAARAVTETGISLKEASQLFDVSKTVLWRTLKKTSNYRPEERFHHLRSEAIEAIQTGDTLISISKRFNIPLATLHRDKVRLHTEGKLPDNCKLTRRESGTSYQKRLSEAIQCCRNGMPQKTASEIHRIPKTTIWRHLQRVNMQQQVVDPLQQVHRSDEEEEADDENVKDDCAESTEMLNSFEEDEEEEDEIERLDLIEEDE